MTARALARALFAWALVLIGILTLSPGEPETPTAPAFCILACGDRGSADALLNIALFVPLGLALRWLGWRVRSAALLAFALTIGVEFAQYFMPGRDASLSDVITNTLGAVLGYALARRALLVLEPGLARSLAFSVFVLGVWLVTGYLVQPALPEGVYYGQWTPEVRALAHYDGRVLEAGIGPLEVRDGRVTSSDSLRTLWQGGRALEVRFIVALKSQRLAPILRVVTEDRHEAVFIGAQGEGIVLRHWTKGRSWRLDAPESRLPDALRGVEPGDDFHISAQRVGERVCLGVADRDACSLGGTVGVGWSLLFYPGAWPGWTHDVLGAIWLLGLVFPIGWWAPSLRWLLADSALLVTALLSFPLLAPLLPAKPGESVAILLGLSLGYATRIWSQPHLRGMERGTAHR